MGQTDGRDRTRIIAICDRVLSSDPDGMEKQLPQQRRGFKRQIRHAVGPITSVHQHARLTVRESHRLMNNPPRGHSEGDSLTLLAARPVSADGFGEEAGGGGGGVADWTDAGRLGADAGANKEERQAEVSEVGRT